MRLLFPTKFHYSFIAVTARITYSFTFPPSTSLRQISSTTTSQHSSSILTPLFVGRRHNGYHRGCRPLLTLTPPFEAATYRASSSRFMMNRRHQSTTSLDSVKHESHGSSHSEKTTSTTKPSPPLCPPSQQILETFPPCVVLMKQLMAKHADKWENHSSGYGILSLAQGVVHWSPPPQALETIQSSLSSPSHALHMYGPADGHPPLLSLLRDKLSRENGLGKHNIMVTAGANQAFMNCVVTLLSEGDRGVVFAPYYFNHVMALQMTRGEGSVVVGPTIGGVPDVKWLDGVLRETMEKEGEGQIKMVTVVNPGNPTGVSLSRSQLREIVNVTKKYGVWLVMDNTYEHFDHVGANREEGDELDFYCPEDDHVINIFSFSKGYSLAGFRVGYLTMNKSQQSFYDEMLKVQDTIPICVSKISQIAALGALSAGRSWVTSYVQSLSNPREAVTRALSPLPTLMGGSGAMYVMAELPPGVNDREAAEVLVEKYGVAVIPGSFCGYEGWIRVCYSNLDPEVCLVAAQRLGEGIEYLVGQSQEG